MKVTEASRRPKQALTLRELTIAIDAISFPPSTDQHERGQPGSRRCSVSIARDETGQRWKVAGYAFSDQWDNVLFYDNGVYYLKTGDPEVVLLTKRGTEKTYRSIDTLTKEFLEILGPRGIDLGVNIYNSLYRYVERDDDE